MSATGGAAGEAGPPWAPASGFPWDDALALGLDRLGWTPRAFWGATPRELAAAAGLVSRHASTAADRTDLERLLAAYPDLPS